MQQGGVSIAQLNKSILGLLRTTDDQSSFSLGPEPDTPCLFFLLVNPEAVRDQRNIKVSQSKITRQSVSK